MCYSSSFYIVIENSISKVSLSLSLMDFTIKASDYLYIIKILSDFQVLDLHTTSTNSQYFSLTLRQAQIATRTVL